MGLQLPTIRREPHGCRGLSPAPPPIEHSRTLFGSLANRWIMTQRISTTMARLPDYVVRNKKCHKTSTAAWTRAEAKIEPVLRHVQP